MRRPARDFGYGLNVTWAGNLDRDAVDAYGRHFQIDGISGELDTLPPSEAGAAGQCDQCAISFRNLR